MNKSTINTLGFGVPVTSNPHHYKINIPAGRDDIEVIEHLGMQAESGDAESESILRVIIPRTVWVAIREPIQREFNARLKKNEMRQSSWKNGINQVDRLLGKELCVLAWATEKSSKYEATMAVRNWLALRPEERWWLFGMAMASGKGQSSDRPSGWRKALYYALCDGDLKLSPTRTRVAPSNPTQQDLPL